MCEELIIEKVEIFGIGPDGEMVTWSSLLGLMYEAMVVARITTTNGLVGISGITTYTEHEFDRSVIGSARLLAPFLIGKDAMNIPEIYADLASRYVPLKMPALSLLDIALYDLKAKYEGVPIYKMLGAAKNKIKAYASSPLLDTNDDYIDYVKDMLSKGFNSIKIHPWCVFEKDYELVKVLQEEFKGQDIGWSFDVDAAYSTDNALKMGRLLDKYEWEFFEAPLGDDNFEGYKFLADKLDIDVIPGGNTITSIPLMRHALQYGCWDRSRFDVTGIGGFTAARKAMALSESYNLKAEVQSWGYTLTQAANLHIMLAWHNCDYFEQAAPYEKYEAGAKQVFRPDENGFIHPTDLNGLGVELDWDYLEKFIYSESTINKDGIKTIK